MAERRMFSRSLVESDNFLSMNRNANILYFYLNLEADDDGFVSTVIKTTGSLGFSKLEGEEAIKELVTKGFILKFESGIILIKHWRQQNQISPSKHKDTVFQQELSQVYFDERTKTYELVNDCNFSAEKSRKKSAQYRLDEYSIDENREDKYSLVETSIGESRLPDCLRFSSLDEVLCTD